MLKFLSIENFALIDRLEVEFEEGLNLVTGETGSGKSILVDAVGLLAGGRAYQETIRQGFDRARLEGLFHLDPRHPALPLLEESSIEAPDGEVIVRREISSTGANKIFVNGRLSTGAFLEELGQMLIDIHGQFDRQQLLHPSRHLDFLDAYAENHALMEQVSELYGRWRRVRSEIAEIRQDSRDRLQRLETLRFQKEEIERLELRPGLESELEEQSRLLAGAETRLSISSESYQLLYENDGAVVEALGKVARRLEELVEIDRRIEEDRQKLDELRYQVEEIAYRLRDYRDDVEFDPARRERIEDRLDEIRKACRKYGRDVEGVLEHYQALAPEIERLESGEERLEELLEGEKELASRYLGAATELSKRRNAVVDSLCRTLERELGELAMPQARFEVRFESDPEAGGEKGIDSAEFLISPNPGEAPRPLAKIASGGELSRIVLALKTILTLENDFKTLIFDEVDAGVGGRVASSVGERLAGLGRSHQVFCVTHSPQIACYAARHLHVEKSSGQGRTTIGIRALDRGERTQELARMLAGSRITSAALKNAEELLRRVGQPRSPA